MTDWISADDPAEVELKALARELERGVSLQRVLAVCNRFPDDPWANKLKARMEEHRSRTGCRHNVREWCDACLARIKQAGEDFDRGICYNLADLQAHHRDGTPLLTQAEKWVGSGI